MTIFRWAYKHARGMNAVPRTGCFARDESSMHISSADGSCMSSSKKTEQRPANHGHHIAGSSMLDGLPAIRSPLASSLSQKPTSRSACARQSFHSRQRSRRWMRLHRISDSLALLPRLGSFTRASCHVMARASAAVAPLCRTAVGYVWARRCRRRQQWQDAT